MKKRIDWIDNLRSIGIFFVVLGHMPSPFVQYVFSFHMPLFFFISGMLYESNQNSVKEFVKRKSQSLLLPYFTLSIILFVIWLLIGKQTGASNSESLSISNNLIGILYAQGGSTYMNWGVPMWFIPCLFIINLLYLLQEKLSPWKKYTLWGVYFILALIFSILNLRLPWSIDIAFICLPFFFVGKWMLPYLINLKIKIGYIALLSVVLFIIHLGLQKFSGRVDIQSMHFGNMLLFFANAFIGIFTYIFISKLLPINAITSAIGKNTLIILAFHLSTLGLFNLIAEKLGVDYTQYPIAQIVLAIAICLLFIPIANIINTYFPFVVGNFKRIKNENRN